jgi:hypothetical protein
MIESEEFLKRHPKDTPISELDLLMEFDVWISAEFGQEYVMEESRDIMQRFLDQRIIKI